MGFLKSCTSVLVISTILGFPALAQKLPTYDELAMPDQSFVDRLPTLDDLTKPRDLEKYEQAAREIFRTSADAALSEIRRQGEDLGLLDTQAEIERQAGERQLDPGFRATVMISAEMGEDPLRELLQRYRGRSDVRFVMKGIPADLTVPTFGLALQKMMESAGGMDGVNLVLDPELFADLGVVAAPVTLIEDMNVSFSLDGRDTGKVVMKAVGLSNVAYVFEAFKGGDSEIVQGSTVAVTEEDLLVRAMREAAEVQSRLTRDSDVIRDRFWKRQGETLEAFGVSPAAAARTRKLFFSYIAEDNITDANGNIIALGGQVFQPNDVMPFDRRIFVFDPASPSEVAFVERELANPMQGVVRTLFVVTSIPDKGGTSKPWDGLQELVTRFRAPVYVLNESFVKSFQIEHTPSVIRPQVFGDRTEVMIDEFALEGSL